MTLRDVAVGVLVLSLGGGADGEASDTRQNYQPSGKVWRSGLGAVLGVNALVVFVQRVVCLMGGMYPQVK